MEWNGILPVRDVSQANFFIWKIHFVNADGFAVHFHYHADRDVILSEKVFDGFLSAVFTGLRNKDIVALSPQSFCLGDPLIFPKTGYAPTDVNEWLRALGIAKSYGINHYRFHTCCPPDAAFTAADLLGIYMEPELPFWGTIAAPGEEGYNEAEQNYLIALGDKMLETFGNHPSFVMFSLGNELWGSPERLGEILRHYKEKDSRHLYTQGCNNFQHFPLMVPEDDYFVGVRLSK